MYLFIFNIYYHVQEGDNNAGGTNQVRVRWKPGKKMSGLGGRPVIRVSVGPKLAPEGHLWTGHTSPSTILHQSTRRWQGKEENWLSKRWLIVNCSVGEVDKIDQDVVSEISSWETIERELEPDRARTEKEGGAIGAVVGRDGGLDKPDAELEKERGRAGIG